MIDISIVIVCMNNLKNLYPCLNSIKRYTTVSYEVFVVAYLFSKENLERVKQDFPWVKFIESNEIRGFSENNNLALRQAKGEYCFILNDDTYFNTPVIDRLLATFKSLPQEVVILSPVTLNKDGSVQRNGKPPYNLFTQLLGYLKMRPYYDRMSKYTNQQGVYQSYNITGAAFVIRRDIFEYVGWFDERYFFCPEDVEVGHKLNSEGKHCYVDANCNIIHYEGVSSKKSRLFYATTIAAYVGNSYFFCNNLLKRLILLLIWRYKLIQHCIAIKIKYSEHHKDYIYIYNEVYNYFKNNIKTKNIFIKEYQKIKDNILH